MGSEDEVELRVQLTQARAQIKDLESKLSDIDMEKVESLKVQIAERNLQIQTLQTQIASL